MGAMRKRSRCSTVVTIEWNAEGGCIENLPEKDLLALAHALGRLAARRDLARAQSDRAHSQSHSKVVAEPDGAERPNGKARALSVTE